MAPVAKSTESMADRYRDVRAVTMRLAAPLSEEDAQIQAMPDVSPSKWHLAHTTWFFETFVLATRPGHRWFDPRFGRLFNSYYESLGELFPRERRGLLSQPSGARVKAYRAAVDAAMLETIASTSTDEELRLVEVGLQHEMQHQELLLTDIKFNFYANPLRPAYTASLKVSPKGATPGQGFVPLEGGLSFVGVDQGELSTPFAFDNESPRHRVFLEPFALASRVVSNAEYLEFIGDQGYGRPELWLADGWSTKGKEGWRAPLYWESIGSGRSGSDDWRVMTFAGMQPLEPSAPVAHVSYFEAEAFARWAGARLPTEAEWETAAGLSPLGSGAPPNFLESGSLAPEPPIPARLGQLFGDVWEWTASPYVPYPGFAPPLGPLGEYNGKFMCNQMVLRGGSCLSPRAHIRGTYRNFFPPAARWQCTGVRLARNI